MGAATRTPSSTRAHWSRLRSRYAQLIQTTTRGKPRLERTTLSPAWVACALLAVASIIVFWPGNLDRWVLAKLIVLGVGTLLALWVAPRGRLPRLILLVGGVGILFLVVSALFSALPLTSLFGRWSRYEGVISIAGYGLALWLGARLLGPAATGRERDFARGAIAVASTVLAFVGLLQVAHAPLIESLLPSDLARPGSLVGNATDQGAIGAALTLVLGASFLRGRLNWLTAIGAIAGVASVIISGSRAALIVLIVGVIALVVIDGLKNGWRRAVVAGGAVGVAVIVILGLTVPTIAARVLGMSPLATSSASDRAIIWGDSLAVVAAHPLLGVGPSGFEDAVAGTHGVAWFSAVGQATILDSPHNFVLQALVVGGPLLLIALFAALVLCAVALVRRYRSAGGSDFEWSLGAAVAAIGIGGVLMTAPTSPVSVALAALLLGSAVAEPSPAPAVAAGRRWPRWLAAAGLAAWIVVCVLTLVGANLLDDGLAATSAKDYARASSDFDQATSVAPWDVDTATTASEQLTSQLDAGDSAARATALVWAKRALAADPRSLPAAKSAITAYLDARELAPAATLTARFAKLLPNDPWIADRYGAIALAEGHPALAETRLLRAAKLDPTSALPWQTLAYLYNQEGDTGKARAAAAHAKTLTAK